MDLGIFGASTLKHFTESIILGFRSEGINIQEGDNFDFALVQIHGSPAAKDEDQKIIEASCFLRVPKFFLIHRPDEALCNDFIKYYFEQNPRENLIFLGDLIYKDLFWENRRIFSTVIPHPHLDFTMPYPNSKLIVGSYTSWGEMRNVQHYFSLVECLRDTNIFNFVIGGRGLDETAFPEFVSYSKEPFYPHFNVQLYHFFGKKRYGESSGSLHRGISIPVIFEANGAERLEGLKTVKIDADEELELINFEKAALEIVKLTSEGINPILEKNRVAAEINSVNAFAKAVLNFMVSR